MRFWPWRRRSVAAPLAFPDRLLGEELVRASVEEVLALEEGQIRGATAVYRGRLRVAPARALERLEARFRPFGLTPFLKTDGDAVLVQAVPLAGMAGPRRVVVNVLLFALTCVTTLVSGALFFASPTFAPSETLPLAGAILSGVPFAATLLAILGVHEFGHYFTARYYRASVSLPYFIPAPPIFLFGTLGAIISMRSPARNRNSLFDIAAAGPLAGLVVAIPAILFGLGWSVVGPVPAGEVIRFGDPLLLRLFVYLTFGGIPAGMDVFLHPVAIAGWAGFFVTALNLFPVGQLDGGRIAYALFGRRHRLVGITTVAATLALGLVTWSPNWFVWAALVIFLIGFHHSPPLDDVTPLSAGRRAVGALCLVLFILLIPPVPIEII